MADQGQADEQIGKAVDAVVEAAIPGRSLARG